MQLCPPCNTLRSPDSSAYAIVSGLCKNRPADYVHDLSKRACYEPTVYLRNISHVIRDMHLACKKGECFPSTKGV